MRVGIDLFVEVVARRSWRPRRASRREENRGVLRERREGSGPHTEDDRDRDPEANDEASRERHGHARGVEVIIGVERHGPAQVEERRDRGTDQRDQRQRAAAGVHHRGEDGELRVEAGRERRAELAQEQDRQRAAEPRLAPRQSLVALDGVVLVADARR